MSENNSQTQTQLTALRTLQQSYDALADASASGAKQGTNASATLTATQAAVVDGNDTSISVGKEIRSEVGTGSDTASETGTLSAVLKWTKNKVKDIYTAVTGITGYALQGSDSTKSITTLDEDLGDVAAALEYMEQGGMPQIAQIAKQGTNANANISEIQTLIGYTISEIDGI